MGFDWTSSVNCGTTSLENGFNFLVDVIKQSNATLPVDEEKQQITPSAEILLFFISIACLSKQTKCYSLS